MLRYLIVFMLLVALPTSSAVAAEPTLTLDGEWFQVVEPYRYVEARRFERGWNRGADVRVVDGRVRSPVTGTVRFAGTVVGRGVVTVATSIGGLDVVLTITGLDRATVRAGDRVDVGDAVGSGGSVHVGVYDRARRSHYLPVLGQRFAPARTSDDSISAAVARRLLDAIDGTAAPRATAFVRGEARAAAPFTGAGAGSRRDAEVERPDTSTGRSSASTAILLPTRGSQMTVDASNPRRHWTRSAEARFGPGLVARDPFRSPRTSGVMGGGTTGKTAPTAPTPLVVAASSTEIRAGSRRMDAPAPGVVPRLGHTSPVRPLPDGPAPSTHARGDRVASATDTSPASLDATTLTLGVLLLVLLLLALVLRRRRRAVRAPVPEIAPPLPVHLPPMPVRRAWRARTDGSSLLPDSALAWPDRDRGTSPRTDHTREPRAPEHA